MRKIIHHIRTLLLTTTLESDNIKDMENTYTQADKDAVRILRAAYLESDASDTLPGWARAAASHSLNVR